MFKVIINFIEFNCFKNVEENEITTMFLGNILS